MLLSLEAEILEIILPGSIKLKLILEISESLLSKIIKVLKFS